MAVPGAGSVCGEVVVHAVAGWLQVVALNVIGTCLPEGWHHGCAIDVGHNGQLALAVQGVDDSLERLYGFRVGQVAGE